MASGVNYRRLYRKLDVFRNYSFKEPPKGQTFDRVQKQTLLRDNSKLDLYYRQAKKRLNKYYKFSFNLPRKLIPSQKATISRKYKELIFYIRRVENEKATFISLPKNKLRKIKGIDGILTNKGVFFKYPNARLSFIRKPKKKKVKEYDEEYQGYLEYVVKEPAYKIKTSFGKRGEIFIPFSDEIKFDLNVIVRYVAEQEKKYKPDYIRWSVFGYKGSTLYTPEAFTRYGIKKSREEELKDETLKNQGYYSGVFFGWEPKGI